MSLYDLQKWAPSVEDFADAHEPVNDGVKEVPNAQTIAASVGKGDVGKDTTNSGEARVIPEQEDTDDNTEKQFDTVSESAEKGGSDSKPAPQASTAKSAETADSGDTGSETKTDAGSESDTQSEGKAPPFVKKDEADTKEPLEHDSKEAAEDEKEKTEKVTKALEAYAPHAQRFDIIGYPKADRDRLQKSMNWLAKRSGLPTGMTISAESIDAVVQAGRSRIDYLAEQVSKHVIANESFDDGVAGSDLNTEPTEHGNVPLPAEAAAAITDLEIGVPEGTFDEDTGLSEVSDAIQTLQEGQVAIEQYLNILRSNKRISKQAAAVLHAGLEAIDQRCGLKVRATGMEGYDTSPKASMEDAAVSEKTLLDRAGEIGAKILKWIKVMIEKAGQAWDKYRMGLDSLKENMVKLKESKFKTEGEIVLRPAPAELFTEGLFTGDWLTPEEERLPGNLATYYTNLTREITRRCRALLSDKSAEDIELVMEALKKEDKVFSKLPGTQQIVSEAGRLHLANADAEQPEEYKVDISDARPGLLLESMIKSLEKLSELDTIAQLKKASDEVVQGLIKYRKGAGKDLNEADFQKLQQTVVDNSVKLFDVEAYFDIMKYIGKVYNARYKLCAQMANNA